VLRKLHILLIGCGALFAVRPAAAQITIEGELSVNSVYRDNALDFLDDTTVAGVGKVGEDGAHFWDSQLNLNFATALSGQVTVVASLQANFLWGVDDTNVDPNDPNRGVSISDDARTEVREAYLEFDEFIWPQLTASLGLQELSYDLRGDGNEFFLNTSERENRRWLDSTTAFNNRPAATRAASSAGFGFAPSNASPATDVPHYSDGISSTAGVLKFVCDTDPVFVDLFLAQLEETTHFRDDHELYGAVIDWLLGEDSILRAHFMYIRDEGALADDLDNLTRGSIAFYQTGLSGAYLFDLGNPLEVYGEFGYQFGSYGDSTDLRGRTFSVDQSAMAFQVGVKYVWESVTYEPWIDLSYTSFTGDNDATDGDQEAWIPYGDIDDTLIFEDNRYGLGVGSGYQALKLKTGFKPSAETDFKMVLAEFRAAEDTFRRIAPGGGATESLDYGANVGRELDFVLTWDYTQDVTIRAGFGIFIEDEFLDDAVDGNGGLDSDGAMLLDLGVKARF